MPPKNQDGQLTEKERDVLEKAWFCFEEDPKINFEKLAKLGGYTNSRSVQNVMYAVKKKIKANVGDGADGEGNDSPAASKASPNKKRTPRTPKSKRTITDADDEEGDETPVSKKAKRTPLKTIAKKGNLAEEKDNDEDEDKKCIVVKDADFLDDTGNGVGLHDDEI